jgi:hypothetical protein
MPLFVCEKCNAIDNTALGSYWGAESNYDKWEDESLNGLALCCECTPLRYSDGTLTHVGGEWHGKFPKEQATKEKILEIGKEHFVGRAAKQIIAPKPFVLLVGEDSMMKKIAPLLALASLGEMMMVNTNLHLQERAHQSPIPDSDSERVARLKREAEERRQRKRTKRQQGAAKQ